MSIIKNYGIGGVAADVQLGKLGTRLISSDTVLRLRDSSGINAVSIDAKDLLLAQTGTISFGSVDTLTLSSSGIPKIPGSAAVILPNGTTVTRPAVGETGMIRVNTNDGIGPNYLEFFDGTTWVTLATGGDATAVQAELNTLEASIGNSILADGTFSGSVFTSGNSTVWTVSPTTLTGAILQLAEYSTSTDSLDEILPASSAGQIIFSGVDNKWMLGLPGQTSGIQPYDAGLAALANKVDSGILVQTGTDSYLSRSIDVSGNGLSVANSNGVAGNPTISLANDLLAIESLNSTGYAVRVAVDQWVQRNIVGSDNIVVSNGDGVLGNTEINLATVTPTVSGSFVKINVDNYGRVAGTSPVVASDIQLLVDNLYINSSGDTVTGDLDFGGTARIIGLPAPLMSSEAATKAYVDGLVTGLSWKNAVAALADVNVDISLAPSTIDGYSLVSGDRVLLTNQTSTDENGIYIFSAVGSPLVRSQDADSFSELNGAAVFVKSGTVYADSGFVQTTTLTSFSGQVWTQFSGGAAYTAGTGLTLTGNSFSANLGAGISELPAGEIGIGLFSPNGGALILTENGSSRSSSSISSLHLLVDPDGGLTQSAAGLSVKSSGITNNMLVNDSISLLGNTGTGAVSLGGTLSIIGNTAQGVVVDTNLSQASISVSDATSTAKGVASYSVNDFTVTAGSVSLNTVSVSKGGTGNTSLVEKQLLIGNGTGPVAQSTSLTFDTTSTQLTIGSMTVTAPLASNPVITTTQTNGNVKLSGNGTGSVIIGNQLPGRIASDSGQSLSVTGSSGLVLTSVGSSIQLVLDSGTTSKVTVVGPTASDYATDLQPNNLTNRAYVDSVVNSARTGTVRAVRATVPLNANGTTNIGAAVPANSVITRVRIVVSVSDTTARISVGKAAATSAYMPVNENDLSVSGIYLSDTYVEELDSTQIVATVTASSTVGSGSAIVMVEYVSG